jgi:hypothetical protein
MDAHTQHLTLWRFRFTGGDSDLAGLSKAVPGIRLYRALDGDEACGYAPAGLDLGVEPTALAGAQRVALRCTLQTSGAAVGEQAPFHYVVATDVLPEHDADFNAWYDTEHLPGLAAVPGTVQAARYRCEGPGPLYHACYDLAALSAFNSAPWLAVRASDWSSRIRPQFRNTQRVMYRRL